MNKINLLLILFFFCISIYTAFGNDCGDNYMYGDFNNNEKLNVMYSTFSKGQSDGYTWHYKQILYKPGPKELNSEVLSSTVWIPSAGPGGYMAVLVFYLDNVFKMGWIPSGCDTVGNYEIIDKKKVRLYNFKSSYDKNTDKKEIVLEIKTGINDFWFTDAMISEDKKITYYPLGAESKVNKEYIYEGIKVLKLCGRYVSKANLKIREKPSIKSGTIENSNYNMEYMFDKKIDMFLKGDDFFVLGRTIEKDNVNGIENYWYLIRFYVYNSFNIGWVFGEYIEKYDNAKEKDYRKSIEAEIRKMGWVPPQ